MKKIFLALIVVFFLTGCTSIQKMSLDEIIDNNLNSNITLANEHRNGYKYYLPKGLRIINQNDYNEHIKSGDYTYYFFVDLTSYYNKVIEKFDSRDDVYYSKAIDFKDKYGYLEVKLIKDNKYLIEIMYNYAKIEVIVRKNDINVTVANAISILSSINYNDTMVEKIVGEELSSFSELEYNIFKTTHESNYLELVSKDVYDEQEEIIPDTDLIK